MIVMLSQVEGKGDFYFLTNEDAKQFLKKIGENDCCPTIFSQPIGMLPDIPVHSQLKYGTCLHDLPILIEM